MIFLFAIQAVNASLTTYTRILPRLCEYLHIKSSAEQIKTILDLLWPKDFLLRIYLPRYITATYAFVLLAAFFSLLLQFVFFNYYYQFIFEKEGEAIQDAGPMELLQQTIGETSMQTGTHRLTAK